jgi:nitroreductase
VPPIPTAAIDEALRAPSVHNSQPWRWRITPEAVELHADPDRHLQVTDPDRRDLVLSCGAALHHLTVALAAHGAAAVVDRLPDPEDSTHLASVSIGPGRPAAADADLFPAIAARRTERRRMSHRPVPAELLEHLAEQARRAGALLVPVAGAAARDRLALALDDASRLQRSAPGYPAELRLWTHRLPAARDGIPATATTAVPRRDSSPPLRAFPAGRLREGRQLTGHGGTDDAAEFVVVATADDRVLDRLRAGEAVSAVLLAATLAGLATTPLSQATEVATVRDALRTDVLHVPEHPQIVLRLGWPATYGEPLPATPRRPLRSVLLS